MDTNELGFYIQGEPFRSSLQGVFDVLEKDELFNDGKNLNDYEKLTRSERGLLAVQRSRKRREYNFRGLGYHGDALSKTAYYLDANTWLHYGINAGVCSLYVYFYLL